LKYSRRLVTRSSRYVRISAHHRAAAADGTDRVVEGVHGAGAFPHDRDAFDAVLGLELGCDIDI
jgi:hypothetical protein